MSRVIAKHTNARVVVTDNRPRVVVNSPAPSPNRLLSVCVSDTGSGITAGDYAYFVAPYDLYLGDVTFFADSAPSAGAIGVGKTPYASFPSLVTEHHAASPVAVKAQYAPTRTLVLAGEVIYLGVKTSFTGPTRVHVQVEVVPK